MLSTFGHLRPAGFLGDSLNWREECVFRCGREQKPSQTDSHTVIVENRILRCSPQIWHADTGCEGFPFEMFSLHQSAAITAEAQKAACECGNGSFRGKPSWFWGRWRGGLKAKRKLLDLLWTLREGSDWVAVGQYGPGCSSVFPRGAAACRLDATHAYSRWKMLESRALDATHQVWFLQKRQRLRVALEASCYADPHSSPKRITGFAALSAHPDGIQGSFDSPEQALQLLRHPLLPKISLT